MGWETRDRGGLYYTRSHKVEGRVVREYIGTGLVGELAAQADQEARRLREATRADEKAERKALAHLLHQLLDLLAGYRFKPPFLAPRNRFQVEM